MMRKRTSIRTRLSNTKARPSWLDWALRGSVFLIATLLTTLILVFDYQGELSSHGFEIGEPAPRTLFSPFEITYVDAPGTREMRRLAKAGVLDVFRLDTEASTRFLTEVDRLFEILNDLRGTDPSVDDVVQGLPLDIREGTVALLLNEDALEDVRKNIQLLFERLPRGGILGDGVKESLLTRGAEKIEVVKGGASEGEYVSVRDIPSLSEATAGVERYLPDNMSRRKNLRASIIEIFQAAVKPDLLYDAQKTQSRRQAAEVSVAPIMETIKKDELVVQRGMLVTPEENVRIEQIQRKKEEQQALKKMWATGLLVLSLYAALFAYLFVLHRRKLVSFRLFLLFHTAFLVSTLLCKVILAWPGASPYLMPGVLAPLLLAMLIRPEFGFFGTLVMAAFISPLSDFSAELVVATLLAGVAGTLASFKVRKRIEFLRIGLVVGLAYFVVIFAWKLYQEYPASEALQIGILGLVNGVLITMPCLFLLLAVFESIFDLATDISLLELSDLNHPLLKKMVIEAPGTYHHSLVVSRLAESACEEIGANALLARVGCYFHDIGKMARSQFFTENNTANFPSKHDKLTPTMSCLIIINHVKDGLELGRKYKLKRAVLNFIPEHQGTGVVYYFYRKALDQAAPGEQVDPNDFRYPGPKPQTRETAVAMLADSTEAASRSLKNPSPESISSVIRKIINDKFIDGQLDECDLTLKDLHRIQDSFIRNLTAILHSRISYPDKPEKDDKPDLFKGGEFQKYRVNPSEKGR